jgi:hypothetical protein
VRANTEQTVSRLNNFIGEIFSGAVDVELPQWPDAVPGPREGESLTDTLLRIRSELAGASGQLAAVRVAPLPASEIRAALIAEVDRLAAAGAPRISVAAGKVTINWPDQMLYALPGSALSAPSGSASALDCWRDRDKMIERPTAGITDLQGAIPSAERPKRVREIEARLLGLEIGEERLVLRALAAGLEVHRRPDASPWAILYSGGPEETAQAEAAE